MDAFFESTRLKVLVLPVGKIKRSTFEHWLGVLKSCSSIALADLTPETNADPSDEFSSIAFRPGFVNLNYCLEYDDDSSALEEFQKSKSVLVIFGILDCQEAGLENLESSYSKFKKKLTNRFPSSLMSRCIGFNPIDGQTDNEIVVIPNVGDINFYIHTVICDVAVLILKSLRDHAAAIELRSVIHSPPASELGYFNATADFQSNFNLSPQNNRDVSIVDAAKLKKRAPGRSQKLIADLLALSGNYPDAAARYLCAIDAAKSSGDTLWYAASLDGYYTMLLALRELGVPVPSQLEDEDSAIDWIQPYVPFSEVVSKFHEVIAAYERAEAPLFVAETCLRLAHAMSHLNSNVEAEYLQSMIDKRIQNKESTRDRISRIFNSDTNGRKPSVKSLAKPPAATEIGALLTLGLSRCTQVSLRTRLSLYLRAAALFESINFYRKQGFFLMAAVNVIIEILGSKSTRIVAVENIKIIETLAQLYGLMAGEQVGWSTIQMEVLDQCILLSEAIQNTSSIGKIIVKCFQKFQTMISLDGMLKIVSKLQQNASIYSDDDSEAQGHFQFLKSISIVEMHADIMPRRSKNLNSGPFLYSAHVKTKQESLIVAGETVEFEAFLENQFSFELWLDSLELIGNGIEFKAEKVNVKLMPSSMQKVVLRGVPKEPGELSIQGLAFRIFGVKEHCTISSKKKPESVKVKTFGSNISQSCKKKASSELVIKVIEELPTLEMRVLVPQKLCKLLEGQTKIITLLLKNVSLISVSYLEIEIIEKWDTSTQEKAIKVNKVPSGIQQEEIVELEIKGKQGNKGARIKVKYGKGNGYHRELNTDIEIAVIPSIEATGFDAKFSTKTRNALIHIDLINKYLYPITVTIRNKQETIPSLGTRQTVLELEPCEWTEADLEKKVPGMELDKQSRQQYWLEYYVKQNQALFESSDGIKGEVDLRNLKLKPEDVTVLWKNAVNIELNSIRKGEIPNLNILTLELLNQSIEKQRVLLKLSSDSRVLLLGNTLRKIEMVSELTEIQVQVIGQEKHLLELECLITRIGELGEIQYKRTISAVLN